MIRPEVNVWDFLKSILNVGNFTRKFKCSQSFINVGNSWPILGKWECMAWAVMQIFFYTDLSYGKGRQSFVIPFITDIMNWL